MIQWVTWPDPIFKQAAGEAPEIPGWVNIHAECYEIDPVAI
jgi:hypothetical protein